VLDREGLGKRGGRKKGAQKGERESEKKVVLDD